MKKRYLIMLPGLLISMQARADISAFDKLLIQYCVPKNGRCDTKAEYTERTVSNTSFSFLKGLVTTHKTVTECTCPVGKMYVDRECITLKCPAGTYISLNNNTNNCSPGMYRGLYRN